MIPVFPDLCTRSYSIDQPEQMDLPDLDPQDLAQDLKNLKTINTYFGGVSATRTLLHEVKKNGKPLQVLDCACGAGDLTQLLAQELPQVPITAVDLHPQTLGHAQALHSCPQITWQQGDMRHLPFADRSFDLVVCQLALHHFSDEDAVIVLKELKRVSRQWVAVTDLRRCLPGYLGVWFLVQLWLRHPMTKHDALLSVRRAFTDSELLDLAARASWTGARHQRLGWFRQLLLLNQLE
jgi:2-polyprenyl-3-methyl-5-hydroxy-6-metoxy-1,4-benzoquinol methylase